MKSGRSGRASRPADIFGVQDAVPGDPVLEHRDFTKDLAEALLLLGYAIISVPAYLVLSVVFVLALYVRCASELMFAE